MQSHFQIIRIILILTISTPLTYASATLTESSVVVQTAESSGVAPGREHGVVSLETSLRVRGTEGDGASHRVLLPPFRQHQNRLPRH